MIVGLVLSVIAAASPITLPEQNTVSAGGESKVRLERAHARLCAPPLSDLDFVLSDVNFKYDRRFTEYSGDISGRMLGALNAADPSLSAQTPFLGELIAAFPGLQKADGHFGADQDLAKAVEQGRDMPILWGNGRLMLAMAEYLRTHEDGRILEAAKKLGDYVISTRPYYGKRENFEKVGGIMASGFTTCYPSLIDGLVALGKVTGEQKYLDEARFIGGLSMLDQAFEGHHSHGRLVAYRGLLDLERITGTSEFLDPIVSACKAIRSDLILPTGGVTEMFDRAYIRDEGCSEADWIRVNLLLWRATGEAGYLDDVEHAIRNHLYATQLSNGAFGHHTFLPVKRGDKSFPAGYLAGYASDSYWCCSMHCTQILSELPSWAVAQQGDAARVTWLAEGAALVELVKGQPVHINVRKTGPVSWQVTTGAKKSALDVKLQLRVPGWAKAIEVNGESKTGENGWAEVLCDEGDEISVTFPDRLRMAGAYGPELSPDAPVRVFSGPDMVCLPDAYLEEGFLANDEIPVIICAEDRPRDGAVSVLVRNAANKLEHAHLTPIAERPMGGCRFLFAVQTVGQKQYDALAENAAPERQPGKPIELLCASLKEYTLYVNGQQVFQGGGWHESPRVTVYLTQPENVIAIKTPSDIESPGMVAMIEANGKQYVTNPGDWTAIFCSAAPPAEWLTNPAAGIVGTGKPKDIGGIGAAPWNHFPGQYENSGARWIWPDGTPGGDQKACLFRYVLRMN